MKLLLALLATILLPSSAAATEQFRHDHVVVWYAGISRSSAEAIGRTVADARNLAIAQYRFDMPETIAVAVRVDPQVEHKLFTDGRYRIWNTIRSEQDWMPFPGYATRVYGMCHEVAHMAMYRSIRDHSWMTADAAEGWALYLGSRMVDAVYAKEGAELWPDRYDYREEGMKRLERGLAADGSKGFEKGAAAWKQLTEIVGDQGIARVFFVWGKTKIDPTNPAPNLGRALLRSTRNERTIAWWQDATNILIVNRAKGAVDGRYPERTTNHR